MHFDPDDTRGQTVPWESCLDMQREAARDAARRAAVLPAYRESWERAGIDAATITAENWQALPFLTKDMLIEAARSRPPFGDRLGVPPEDLAHVFAAPGPLYMPFTRADMDHVAGSFAMALGACGLGPGDIVDQTTMYNWVIAATVIDRALQMIGCCVVPGGVGQSDRHLEVMHDLGVTAIVAFPTFLEHLLDLAATEGRPLPLRKAVVMGELSHPDTKQKLRAQFGLEVREFYGIADVGAVAWECAAGGGMHLRDDLLVEFVAPGGTAPLTPASGTPAEMVVTDFRRQAMPIIRLRTGDMIDELIIDPCPCGCSSPRFRRIVGRASEITKVKGMFVVPRQVHDILRRNGIDRRFRLVVDRKDGGRDSLTLEIAGGVLDQAEALKSQVESALRLRIDLACVETLPEDGPQLVDRRLQKQTA